MGQLLGNSVILPASARHQQPVCQRGLLVCGAHLRGGRGGARWRLLGVHVRSHRQWQGVLLQRALHAAGPGPVQGAPGAEHAAGQSWWRRQPQLRGGGCLEPGLRAGVPPCQLCQGPGTARLSLEGHGPLGSWELPCPRSEDATFDARWKCLGQGLPAGDLHCGVSR